MFYTIATATKKVTGTTGVTAGFTDILGDIFKIDEVIRVAGLTRWFAISAGGIVTDKTIDPFFCSKIKIVILPAITNMTGSAVSKVRLRCNTEIVEDIFLPRR